MRTVWRLIDSGVCDPYMNMAIDTAIVQLMKPFDPPVLRFFDWSKPAISAGYSQKIKEISDISYYRKEGMTIVRRPTGGGIVFHGSDITYSVILPKKMGLGLRDMHGLVQLWIKNGLDKLGLNISQYRNISKGVSDYCSTSPSFGDLLLCGTKIGGLAGRRIRQKFLFQGYLNIDLKGQSKDTVRRTIIDNWLEGLKKTCLNDNEEDLAGAICNNKYCRDEWNFMR